MKRLISLGIALMLAIGCVFGALADASRIWILGMFASEPVGTMDVYFQAADANNDLVMVNKDKLSFRVDNSVILNNVLNLTNAEGISYIFVVDCSCAYSQTSNDYVSAALSAVVNGMRSQDNAYFITMNNKAVDSRGYMTSEKAREYANGITFQTKGEKHWADIQAPLWDGINMAGELAAQQSEMAKPIKVVLIFTDAVDNGTGKSADNVLSVFGNCKDTPVYAFVAIGDKESGDSRIKNSAVKTREGLNRLKNQNGGSYYGIGTVAAGSAYGAQANKEIQSILCATVDIIPLSGGADQEFSVDMMYDGEDKKISTQSSVRINRAAIPTPTPTPVQRSADLQFTWEELTERPADLNTIQSALNKSGYLAVRSGELDKETKQAIFDFCVENNCRNMNEGVSREAWNTISSGNFKAKQTPTPEPVVEVTPTPVPTLIPGLKLQYNSAANNPTTVMQVQNALVELKYLNGNYEPAQYDALTHQAVISFCKKNGLPNPDEGLTEEAYALLISDKAKPAVTPTPTPTPEPVVTPTPVPTLAPGLKLQYNSAANNETTVIQVQNALAELKYLTGSYEAGKYDAMTHQAVISFCRKNGLPDAGAGLTEEAYDLLISDKAKPAVTAPPSPTPVPSAHPFDPDTTDPMVGEYQARLNELGYFEGRPFEPGKYDEATQAAQDRFCDVMGIERQVGASVELQEMVTGSSAKPNEQRPLLERVKIRMMGETEIAGYIVPTWALVAAIAVLAVVAIVVIILLIKSSKKKAPDTQENASSIPGAPISGSSSIPMDYDSNERTVDLSDDDDDLSKTVVGDSQNITLRIDYNGTSADKAYELNEGIPLIIGRGTDADIRTNKDDMRISRTHGQFVYRNGEVYYADMSKAGSVVDGRTLHGEEVRIQSGTTIHISNHIIKVQM